MNNHIDRILVCAEVDGKLYQVPLSEGKRVVIKETLRSLFDGTVTVVKPELPIEIKEK